VSGQLLGNAVLFARVLRGVGLHAPPSRLADFARALEHVSIGRRGDFYHAARSLFVRRREEMRLFDEAFEVFWRKPAEGATGLDLRAMGERRRFRHARFDPASAPGPEDSPREGERRDGGRPLSAALVRTWSAREVLRHKDFGEMTAAEREEVRELLAREAVLRVRERRTRRLARSRRGLADLRRTLRRSLVHGGELLCWERRFPRTKPRRLVVLADISGSMEPYTRMLLLFLYGLTAPEHRSGVEVFLFATRLTRVTRELGEGDAEQALAAVSRAVPDWSGGTRIGEAVRTFNFLWSRRVLRSDAVVLVVSDGWDRGDPDLLAREMERLQLSCHRLLWLNPLLASPRYEPLARGMKAARPYIDDFLAANNVASLGQLARRLEELPSERPARLRMPPPGR
jgi:uncharacterized protein